MIQNLTEFKSFLVSTKQTLQNISDHKQVIKTIEESAKKLIDIDIVYLMHKKQDNNYFIPSLSTIRQIDTQSKNLFCEVISTRQTLLVQDVSQSLLFDSKHDSLIDRQPLKDVIIIPIDPYKNETDAPLILLWGANTQSSTKTVTQKHILYLIKFLHALQPYFAKLEDLSDSDSLTTLEQCIEQNEIYEHKIEHNTRYFNSIIHDIRTPMNALIGFLELLLANENDQSKIDYLSSALKSGEHMVRLINDALDIAKIESGELPVEKHPFNIHEELSDTIRIFFETAHKKKVLLCAYFDPHIPEHITSDAYRIKQVLSNLLSNAIKFTPEGGEVLVEVLYNKQDNTVMFSVTDTGKGIAPEALETIFVPYKQENSQTEREYGGTGLGLSISHQIVTMLGGTLYVESILGKGSKFYFVLPSLSKGDCPLCNLKKPFRSVFLYKWEGRKDLRSNTLMRYLQTCNIDITPLPKNKTLSQDITKQIQTNDILIVEKTYFDTQDTRALQELLDRGVQVVWLEDVFDTDSSHFKGNIRRVTFPILAKTLCDAMYGSQTVHDLRPTLHPKNLGNKRVAVVDDNRINLKFMEAILSKYGIQTYTFDDAQSALETLYKDPFDLVFIDEQMPHMEGSTAIRHLRTAIKEGKIPPLHIVSLSGDSAKEHEILEAGADMFLTKPIHIESLENALYRYLNT